VGEEVAQLGDPTNSRAVRESTRDVSRVVIVLPPDVADRLQRDTTKARVMVFCTAENHSYKPAVISFPTQVELRCNGKDPGANLKGVKGKNGTTKYGSTRPADITSLLRKKEPAFRNEVELTYALTNKVRSPPLSCSTLAFPCVCPISKPQIRILTGETTCTEVLLDRQLRHKESSGRTRQGDSQVSFQRLGD
jgi:hypothetical protein